MMRGVRASLFFFKKEPISNEKSLSPMLRGSRSSITLTLRFEALGPSEQRTGYIGGWALSSCRHRDMHAWACVLVFLSQRLSTRQAEVTRRKLVLFICMCPFFFCRLSRMHTVPSTSQGNMLSHNTPPPPLHRLCQDSGGGRWRGVATCKGMKKNQEAS